MIEGVGEQWINCFVICIMLTKSPWTVCAYGVIFILQVPGSTAWAEKGLQVCTQRRLNGVGYNREHTLCDKSAIPQPGNFQDRV